MITILLSALLLSSPARSVGTCPSDAMREEWQSISFALWLTDSNNPDDSPRAATLHFSGCEVDDSSGQERRTFLSEDRSIGVIASVDSSDLAATGLILVTRGPQGTLAESAPLGAMAHRRLYFRGVGFDRVQIRDWRNGGADIVKNVFVIPEGAVVKKPTQ